MAKVMLALFSEAAKPLVLGVPWLLLLLPIDVSETTGEKLTINPQQ